jgi:hypothetical protein
VEAGGKKRGLSAASAGLGLARQRARNLRGWTVLSGRDELQGGTRPWRGLGRLEQRRLVTQQRVSELLCVDLTQQMAIDRLGGTSSALHDRYIDAAARVLSANGEKGWRER